MKLNLKKIKLNQVVLFVAIALILIWIGRRALTTVELNEGTPSEAMTYLEVTENPNAFILYGMVKKQTDDEEKQKKVLTLATENKWGELKEFLATI
jgi:hypothetical protein